VFVCKRFRFSDNRTCAVPKLSPNSGLVAFVTVGSGTVCDGGYGMKWGNFVVVSDRRGTEVARYEGYSFPEWLPDGPLLMMGTSAGEEASVTTSHSSRVCSGAGAVKIPFAASGRS